MRLCIDCNYVDVHIMRLTILYNEDKHNNKKATVMCHCVACASLLYTVCHYIA